MITKETSIVIDRPVEQVFAVFADKKNQPQWDPGLLEARLMPEGPVRVGTRITEMRRFMGRVFENTGEVIEFEPNARITRKSVDQPMAVVGTVAFTSIPKRTKISWKWDLQFSGFLALAVILIAGGNEKRRRDKALRA